jgi:hypothetical protein
MNNPMRIKITTGYEAVIFTGKNELEVIENLQLRPAFSNLIREVGSAYYRDGSGLVSIASPGTFEIIEETRTRSQYDQEVTP